jgi:K+-transporting ATPase KdpF subunit
MRRTSGTPRGPQREGLMLIVSAIVGVILLGYLLYALLKPEKLG